MTSTRITVSPHLVKSGDPSFNFVEIHVNAAKLKFEDVCKILDADTRMKLFNVMLDDLFITYDHRPLMYFNWDKTTIKQLTTRLINVFPNHD